MAFVRRLGIVLVGFVLLFWVSQWLLSHNDVPEAVFLLEGRSGESVFQYGVNDLAEATLNQAPSDLPALLEHLKTLKGKWDLLARDGEGQTLFAAKLMDGVLTLDGHSSSFAQLAHKICQEAPQPTQAMTISEVLAFWKNRPSPTRSKVSFPQFPFEKTGLDNKAALGKTLMRGTAIDNEKEIIKITAFDEAPMLKDMESMDSEFRPYFPKSLPPVEERLPINPAVVIGPDSPGEYGGMWQRAAGGIEAGGLDRKIHSESFVRFDPAGRIQPGLAWKWDVSPDNRIFTFYLRKGHKWSDGHPFTAVDFVWVCNTIISSATWTDPPNWMLATNGMQQLYAEEIDWAGFAAAIREGLKQEGKNPAKRLAACLDSQALEMLKGITPDNLPDKATQSRLTLKLNTMLDSRDFYSPGAWVDIDLTQDLKALMDYGPSRLPRKEHMRKADDPGSLETIEAYLSRADLARRHQANSESLDSPELRRLNVLMIRAAFPKTLGVPRKRRVKVEAIDDNTVRLTFPRPNALFLEKCATFMFYRGLFSTPKHFSDWCAPSLHPELMVMDVLDWEGFVGAIRDQANNTEPSPGRQLWLLMDKAGRTALMNGDKSKALDAINQAIIQKDFYVPEAFANVDFKAMQKKITADGYSIAAKDLAFVLAYNEFLILDDLRYRADKEGYDSLSKKERLNLGVGFLRAVFSDGFTGKLSDETGVLASNREMALNIKAMDHPNKYDSWTVMRRTLKDYHLRLDPYTHVPTLSAWRSISEPGDMVQKTVRNPYYYRVDGQGRQLPYLDGTVNTVTAEKNARILKFCTGNVDFQSREVGIIDFPILKQHEKKGNYEVRLWAADDDGGVQIIFFQLHKNPEYQKLMADSRFREAMSLAINRKEIIDVIYGGLGAPAQFAIPKGSPYYHEGWAKRAVQYDTKRANAILDSLGLKRGSDGLRRFPSGEKFIFEVTVKEASLTLVTQMLCQYWQAVGVDAKLVLRSSGLVNRLQVLKTMDCTVSTTGCSFFGPLLPGSYAPSHAAESVQWSRWVAFIRSSGAKGEAPPERLWEIERLWQDVQTASNDELKMAAWELLMEAAEADISRLGLVTPPGKPILVKNNFKNVPKKALAGWIAHDPSNCCPESFYKTSN